MTSSDALTFTNSKGRHQPAVPLTYVREEQQEFLARSTVDLTVAIPTYNGDSRLPAVLNQLRAQVDTARITWEVIVADNNSQDNTAAVVRQYQEQWSDTLPLRYVFAAEQGAAFARQRAVEAARGSIVAFLDDDNIPAADWIANVYRFAQANPETGAFGSQIHGEFESPLPEELKDLACFLAVVERGQKPHLYEPLKKILPPGAGLAVRRSAWLESVPKRLFLNHKGKKAGLASEDLEAVLHIQKAGWEVWHNPGMVVYHRIPTVRLQAKYLRSLFRCIGLSRFYIRMLGTRDWQRPLMVPAYIANDFRRLALHYLREGRDTSALSLDESCKREYLHSTATSPFFLLKKVVQSKINGSLEHARFPEKELYLKTVAQAFEQQSFDLYAQSVVPVEDYQQTPLQTELLVRLAPLASTSPQTFGSFWAFAESYNLAGPIDRWVVDKVFKSLAQLNQKLSSEGCRNSMRQYSINLSRNSVLDTTFSDFINASLIQHGLAAQSICFEIKTTVALAHPQATMRLVNTLGEIGCAVTLDSFALRRITAEQSDALAVDFIKLAPQLLHSTKKPPKNIFHLKEFLATNHNKTVLIAKGVENTGMLEKTHRLGIQYAQGYQLSKPQVWPL